MRKKVLGVLASWSRQFKDDRSAAGIAGLYRQVKPAQSSRKPQVNVETLVEPERGSEQKRRDKEGAKRKGKEKRLKAEESRRKKAATQTASSRREFDFERVRFAPGSTCPRTTPLTCTSRTGEAAGPHCHRERVVCCK